MQEFTYDALPGRVVFGAGALNRIPEEVERLGSRRVLVVSTRSQSSAADIVKTGLGDRFAGLIPETVMHVPTERADAAGREAERLDADLILCIGGGAAIGLGKAIALERAVSILAIPTTYAGSEMTTIWGITEGGVKRVGRDIRVLPKTVVYDPELTLGLPPHIGGQSGMNALAHCVESLYAANASPVTTMMAEAGIRALAESLPVVIEQPNSIDARSTALYGAYLGGAALGVASMGIHHKLCHILGGGFDLPHAETHTVILPHAAAYNRDAAPEAMARIAGVLGSTSAPAGLYDLAAEIGAPLALKDIGMTEAGLAQAAALATESPTSNPRPVELAGVRALLDNAFHGKRPDGGA